MTFTPTMERGIVIAGASGLLGRQLFAVCAAHTCEGAIAVHALTHQDLDICDCERVGATLDSLRPGVVLNAAAYTDVDGCESNVKRAFDVNERGPRNLADACKRIGALLVHYSTDFVFDGAASQPYRPDDVTAPICVYGESKQAGERAIQETECAHLIVRTSWLFGPGGKNFVDTIRARARRGEALRVVTDQVGRPTYSVDLAEATWRLLEANGRGVVHFANSGSCSWYSLAREVIQLVGCGGRVEPITSEELDRRAKRPAYSVLDLGGYERLTNGVPRPWNAALAEYMRSSEPVGRTGGETGRPVGGVVSARR